MCRNAIFYWTFCSCDHGFVAWDSDNPNCHGWVTKLAKDSTASAVHDCTDGKRYPLRHIALDEAQDERCQNPGPTRTKTDERLCFERFCRKLELFSSMLGCDNAGVEVTEGMVKCNEKRERRKTKTKHDGERASRDDIRPTLEPELTAERNEELMDIRGQSACVSQSKATTSRRDSMVSVSRPSYRGMQQPISPCVTEAPQPVDTTPLCPHVHCTVDTRSIAKTTLPKNLIPPTYSYTALRYPQDYFEDSAAANNDSASMQQLDRSSSRTTGLRPPAALFAPNSPANAVKEHPSGRRRNRRRWLKLSTLT